jgi:hypothetical protein
MDVSQLQVAIGVDISDFEDAMEKVSAMLLAAADQFQKASEKIAGSFSGIGKSGEESKSSLSSMVDFLVKSTDIFGAFGKITKGTAGLLKEFGAAGEVAAGVPLAESIGGLAEVAGIATGPIGTVVGLILSMGLAYLTTKKSTDEATESMIEFNEHAAATRNRGNFVPPESFQDFLKRKEAEDAKAKENPYTPEVLNNMSEYVHPTQIVADRTYVPKSSIPGLDDSSDATGNSYSQGGYNANSAMASFQKKYDEILKGIQKMIKGSQADIKVSVNGSVNGQPSGANSSSDISPPPQLNSAPAGSIPNNSQPVDPNMAMVVDNTTSAVNEYTDSLKNLQGQEKDNSTSAQQLAQVFDMASSGIGTAIGNMANGGKNAANGLKDMLKSFVDALADFVIKKGEALILTGSATEVGSAGSDPQGWLQIAEGSALVTAASAVKAIKMATGGIVSGSTFANIGEYAGASHNPEVVAPLDKLRKMISGNTGGGHYSFEMQGDKMVAAMQRQSNNSNFVLGTNNQ